MVKLEMVSAGETCDFITPGWCIVVCVPGPAWQPDAAAISREIAIEIPHDLLRSYAAG